MPGPAKSLAVAVAPYSCSDADPVGFGPDDRPVFLLAGTKAGVGHRWYEANVPIADGRLDIYLAALRKSKEKRNERGPVHRADLGPRRSL